MVGSILGLRSREQGRAVVGVGRGRGTGIWEEWVQVVEQAGGEWLEALYSCTSVYLPCGRGWVVTAGLIDDEALQLEVGLVDG